MKDSFETATPLSDGYQPDTCRADGSSGCRPDDSSGCRPDDSSGCRPDTCRADGCIQSGMLHFFAAVLCVLPLSIMLASTAMVLEIANRLRWSAVPDDALPPSLFSCIHPSVFLFLALGYVIAIGIPVAIMMRVQRRQRGN